MLCIVHYNHIGDILIARTLYPISGRMRFCNLPRFIQRRNDRFSLEYFQSPFQARKGKITHEVALSLYPSSSTHLLSLILQTFKKTRLPLQRALICLLQSK